jgi:hypothetical protein
LLVYEAVKFYIEHSNCLLSQLFLVLNLTPFIYNPNITFNYEECKLSKERETDREKNNLFHCVQDWS